jgi:hypothetical protein
MKIKTLWKYFNKGNILPLIMTGVGLIYFINELLNTSGHQKFETIFSMCFVAFLFFGGLAWGILEAIVELNYDNRGKLVIDQIPYLDDADPVIRRNAIQKILEIGHNSALPKLAERLHDKDLGVREAALNALIAIDEMHVIDELIGVALYDNNDRMQFLALEGLSGIGRKAVDIAQRPVGANILASSKKDELIKIIDTLLLPGLTEALNSKDDLLRATTLSALAAIVDAEALDEIRQISSKQARSPVEFTVYFPHQVKTEDENYLFIYAHSLGENDLKGLAQADSTKTVAQIKSGTILKIIPECDQISIEPSFQTIKWIDNWINLSFVFKPLKKLARKKLEIRIAIQVEGIEISNIKIPIDILAPRQTRTINSLAKAKLNNRATTIYQKIFVSYSREDNEIVEIYRLAQLAVGNDIFVDTYSIRAGEDWKKVLACAIDSADVFQLFWSKKSANSRAVHDEWNYALEYKCPRTKCIDFIRPVYWEAPLVPPPDELSHLHFRYIPLSTVSKGSPT